MSIRSRAAVVAACLVAIAPVATAAPASADRTHRNGQIAFARYVPRLDDTVFYTVNPNGTHAKRVVPFALECPNWSPDGSRLASCGGPNLTATAIVDPDTGSYRLVPMPRPGLLTFCYLWTPNARRLACESFGETDGSLNGIYSIRVSDGKGLRKLTSNPNGDDTPVAYSPDGDRLAFIRSDDNGNTEGLFVARSNGTHPRQIAPAGVTCCEGGWSSHGNWIVFSRHVTPDVHSSIWVVHPNGTGLREVPADPTYGCGGPIADPQAAGCFDPRWSPDGRQIVFGSGDDTLGRNIWTVRPDGSDLHQVTHGGVTQSNEAPDWGRHPLAH
jgi:Tol biopolymer transport system component